MGYSITFQKNQLPPGLEVPIMASFVTISLVILLVMMRLRYDLFRSKFEISPLARGLETLVSRESQMEEHSIDDIDERIIFSLRIAEGESALEYADWVSSSALFPRFYKKRSPDSEGSTRHYRSRTLSL